jgi:hypothetical protein
MCLLWSLYYKSEYFKDRVKWKIRNNEYNGCEEQGFKKQTFLMRYIELNAENRGRNLSLKHNLVILKQRKIKNNLINISYPNLFCIKYLFYLIRCVWDCYVLKLFDTDNYWVIGAGLSVG